MKQIIPMSGSIPTLITLMSLGLGISLTDNQRNKTQRKSNHYKSVDDLSLCDEFLEGHDALWSRYHSIATDEAKLIVDASKYLVKEPSTKDTGRINNHAADRFVNHADNTRRRGRENTSSRTLIATHSITLSHPTQTPSFV